MGSNPTRGMDVCCDCRVLSGRGLCVGLITRPEKSYRLLYVVLCDLETSRMRSHDPRWGAAPQEIYIYIKTWRMREFVRWERHLHHLFWDPEVLFGNKC